MPGLVITWLLSEVYDKNKNVTEGKKKKSLKAYLDFLVPIKLTPTTRGGKKGLKKSKLIYRTSQKLKIIKVYLESLLSESFPVLRITVHLTCLGCPPALC